MSFIDGIDVWDGYGKIDWSAVAAQGFKFAFVRATGYVGVGGKDKRTLENIRGAKAAGLLVGVYHVGHIDQDPEKAARSLYDYTEGCGSNPGELPPVYDIEVPQDPRPVADRVVRSMVGFADASEALFGRPCIHYSYPNYLQSLGAALDRAVSLGRCGFWYAGYWVDAPWYPTAKQWPKPVGPFGEPLFWQYSAERSRPVDGIEKPVTLVNGLPSEGVDRNVFRGTLDDLRALALLPPEPFLRGVLPISGIADDAVSHHQREILL